MTPLGKKRKEGKVDGESLLHSATPLGGLWLPGFLEGLPWTLLFPLR